MGEAAAEISKAGRVGVEEDSMDLAVGNGQGDSGEGIPVSIEDQRGLPVELSLFDFELGATGRRGHEGGHVRRALERPPEVADAPESAALWSAVRDQDGVRGEQVRERRRRQMLRAKRHPASADAPREMR
jgi:hypothetical protein